jgi:putative intracellular protease/amidase
MLRNNGGKYSKKPNWHPYAVTDGDLITGQNPGSSESTARELLHRWHDHGKSGQTEHRSAGVHAV